jgi:hypothetical protein
LRQALTLNAARLRKDPKALDLQLNLQKDPRFEAIRQMPEFKQLTGSAP